MNDIQTVQLTTEQMLDHRKAALDAAAAAHSGQSIPEILHAAGAYLGFMLNGLPVMVIGQTVRETKMTAEEIAQIQGAQLGAGAAAPAAPKEKKPRKVTAASADSLIAGAVAPNVTAPSQTAPLVAAATAPVTTSAPVPTTTQPKEIAPPTTIQIAADSLKALVQDTAPGRGRAVAIALLAEFGVTQLAQIPGPKLAEFKVRCDSAGKAEMAANAPNDPTGGLLG